MRSCVQVSKCRGHLICEEDSDLDTAASGTFSSGSRAVTCVAWRLFRRRRKVGRWREGVVDEEEEEDEWSGVECIGIIVIFRSGER